LVKEATGNDLTTNCSHAITNTHMSAVLIAMNIFWDVTYSENGGTEFLRNTDEFL
jgi:hypothetical protein